MSFEAYLQATFLPVLIFGVVGLAVLYGMSKLFQRLYIALLPEEKTNFEEFHIPWIFWLIMAILGGSAAYLIFYGVAAEVPVWMAIVTFMQTYNLLIFIVANMLEAIIAASLALNFVRNQKPMSEVTLLNWSKYFFVIFTILVGPIWLPRLILLPLLLF